MPQNVSGEDGPRVRRDPRRSLGRRGEELAARYLENRGYRIVSRNYRLPFGEIDLVAEANGILAFCEVKSRTGITYGRPFEAVVARKQRRLCMLAQAYLQDHPHLSRREIRFDVLSVYLSKDGPYIEHILNAF